MVNQDGYLGGTNIQMALSSKNYVSFCVQRQRMMKRILCQGGKLDAQGSKLKAERVMMSGPDFVGTTLQNGKIST